MKADKSEKTSPKLVSSSSAKDEELSNAIDESYDSSVEDVVVESKAIGDQLDKNVSDANDDESPSQVNDQTKPPIKQAVQVKQIKETKIVEIKIKPNEDSKKIDMKKNILKDNMKKDTNKIDTMKKDTNKDIKKDIKSTKKDIKSTRNTKKNAVKPIESREIAIQPTIGKTITSKSVAKTPANRNEEKKSLLQSRESRADKQRLNVRSEESKRRSLSHSPTDQHRNIDRQTKQTAAVRSTSKHPAVKQTNLNTKLTKSVTGLNELKANRQPIKAV